MKNAFLAILCALALLPATSRADAITVSLDPAAQTVQLGATMTLDLVVSGLGAGTTPSIGTFDVDVSFDSSLLSFVSASFGTGLDVFGFGANPRSVTPGAGSLNLFELSLDLPADLDALQPDSFTLASLSFQALALGTSPSSITINALGDSLGDPLTATVSGANITVAQVPEPSLAYLLGTGLAILVLVRKRLAA